MYKMEKIKEGWKVSNGVCSAILNSKKSALKFLKLLNSQKKDYVKTNTNA